MAKSSGGAKAHKPILQAVASAARSHGVLAGAAACAMAWALLVRFSSLLFAPGSSVGQSGVMGVASVAALFAGVLLIPEPNGRRAPGVVAAVGALCAVGSTVLLGLVPAPSARGLAAYGIGGVLQGVAYACATWLAVACYRRLGFRGSLVAAASSFTAALAVFAILGAAFVYGAVWCAALLPVGAAVLFVLGWRRDLAPKPLAQKRPVGRPAPEPARTALVALLVLAGLLAAYMPAMYPKTTNLAPQALGAFECVGLASWRCLAALALAAGLLWLAVGIAYRRRATVTAAALLALALFAAIFFMLPSMGTSAAAFVLFVACGVLAALFAVAFLLHVAGQGSGPGVRRGLAVMTGGALAAAVFAYVFLGPLYNVTTFQDLLFSVVPAVLLIAFVGAVFVLRGPVAGALAAWGVWAADPTASGAPADGTSALADGGRGGLEVFSDRYGLTKRELEVLALLAEGRNEPYVESALGISRTTVKTHITHIYRKVGVSSRQQLIDVLRG